MATTDIERRAPARASLASTLARDVDRLLSRSPTFYHFPFRNPLGQVFHLAPLAEEFTWLPAAEMVEDKSEYVITAEVPGLKKENIKVEYADGVLSVSGERKEEEKREDSRYFFYERSYGGFQRAFTFPTDVDSQKITAGVKDGVLTVHVPKSAREKVVPKTITVADAK
jgi:HSP20 family molecular chaperone IbpA